MPHHLLGVTFDVAFGLVGQERLAGCHCVGRRAAAHHGIRANGLRAVDLVHVDDIKAVQHRQVHGLAGLICERAHVGRGQLAHVQLRQLPRRQFEQAHGATVTAAVVVLDDIAGVDQRLQGAMRIAAGQAHARRQRIDGARRIVHIGHRFQHHQPFEQRLVHS
ncbi:hypothetical protein ASD71_11385 [Achromobacter sp. Root565]|nr:hypothetical protein ASD71_11385 [Achromobacter sp. Root565]